MKFLKLFKPEVYQSKLWLCLKQMDENSIKYKENSVSLSAYYNSKLTFLVNLIVTFFVSYIYYQRIWNKDPVPLLFSLYNKKIFIVHCQAILRTTVNSISKLTMVYQHFSPNQKVIITNIVKVFTNSQTNTGVRRKKLNGEIQT